VRARTSRTKTAARCSHCGKQSPFIAGSLGLCSDCIRHNFEQVVSLSGAGQPVAIIGALLTEVV